MKAKGYFLIGLCVMSLLLASCQSSVDASSDRTAKEGEAVARLVDTQGQGPIGGIRGMLHGRGKKTVTPRPHKTKEAPTPTPTSTPLPPPPSTSTPLPVPTATPLPVEPTASPALPVTVSDFQIYPAGEEIARIEFLAMVSFNSSVNTKISMMGFFIRQGQALPSEATCGQIPEASLASPTWNPPALAYAPGSYNYRDWGYLPAESIPADMTHFVVTFVIKTQPDNAIAYCKQKVLARSSQPIPALPGVDANAIIVEDVVFWPDVAVVDRNSTFDFGARLDFESIIMNQVRLLAFYLYNGQEVPGESACMSKQMPGRSGEVFWSTGASTRFWTGTSRFEQVYSYQATAPDDATHLVMWLMLDDSYNRPVLCWQNVIELAAASR